MSTTIKLKRGSGSNPQASDLAVGEVAVRTDTGRLFTKKDNGSIADVGGGVQSGAIVDSDISASANISKAKLAIADATTTTSGYESAADKAKLNGIESGATADQTASEIVALVADQTIAPSTIDMEDNEKILLGNSDDLEIYHNGNHSKIIDTGTGNLYLESDSGNIYLRVSNNEQGVTINQDGEVEIYFNNVKKAESCNTGFDVFGCLQAETTSSKAGIIVKGDGSSVDGYIQLNCWNNNHGVKLKAPPHSAAATYTLVLPNDIQNGKYLTVDSNGNTSWGTPTNTTYSVGDGGLTQKNFTTTLKNKLDGIEANATADQSNSEIKTAYEANSNTNAFTDALLSKLNGIAASATNVTNNNQLTNGAGYVTANTQLSNEQVQDIVGAMVTGNTESGITVTYQDGDGTLDFSVASQTAQNFTTALKNKLDGIAASATNVTNNNQLTNGAGYITSAALAGASDGGNAALLDGIDSTQFLRADQDDSTSGILTLTTNSQYPLKIDGDHNGKILLKGSSNPYIRFQEGATDKAYIQWSASGYLQLVNQESGEVLRIKDGNNGLIYESNGTERTVYHSGNLPTIPTNNNQLTNGAGYSTFSGSYNDLSNKPTIPTNNNQLTNGAGYITSANGGNAATLDGIDSSQFVRSDTADTITATLTARTILPQSGNTYNLGSSSARWNNLYVNDMHFSNEGSQNSVDGTWGDWTLQEGETELYMINNRSGQKFKIAMIPV